MKVVVRIKLLPSLEQARVLEATLRACNRAANHASRVAQDSGAWHKYALQEKAYHQLKAEFGLSAQPEVRVIAKVADAYTIRKANLEAGNLGRRGSAKRQRAESTPITFRPDAAQPFDDRCLSWQMDARTVSIWMLSGRLKNLPFTSSPDQLKLLAEHRQGESDLICQDGNWFLSATCEVPVQPLNEEPEGFIGVDLGIVEIATTLNGRLRRSSFNQRATLHSWSFAQLRDFITYKARRAGVPVVVVDPAYTSQTCSECDHTSRANRPGRGVFACRGCGVVLHADVNASLNIAHRGEVVWIAGRSSTGPALSG